MLKTNVWGGKKCKDTTLTYIPKIHTVQTEKNGIKNSKNFIKSSFYKEDKFSWGNANTKLMFTKIATYKLNQLRPR